MGMLLTGNMNPDRRIVGIMKRKVTMNASCCVFEIVEIQSPMPSPGNR